MSASTEPGTVVTLPIARDVAVPGLADLLAEVRAVVDEVDHDDTVGGTSWDDEFVAQDLALAGESAHLRARADRYTSAVAAGGSVDGDAIQDVLRAFRSYHPLLGARDRRLNAAAYRRLSAASAPAPHRAA